MSKSVTTHPVLRCLEEALSEVDREVQVRRRCFDRWVQDGKLSSVDAKDRFDRMFSARAFLARLTGFLRASAMSDEDWVPAMRDHLSAIDMIAEVAPASARADEEPVTDHVPSTGDTVPY